MKKHKRDPEHRSYVKGYQAAIQGRSLSVCPHQENTTIAYHWSRGWREGRQDGDATECLRPTSQIMVVSK